MSRSSQLSNSTLALLLVLLFQIAHQAEGWSLASRSNSHSDKISPSSTTHQRDVISIPSRQFYLFQNDSSSPPQMPYGYYSLKFETPANGSLLLGMQPCAKLSELYAYSIGNNPYFQTITSSSLSQYNNAVYYLSSLSFPSYYFVLYNPNNYDVQLWSFQVKRVSYPYNIGDGGIYRNIPFKGVEYIWCEKCFDFTKNTYKAFLSASGASKTTSTIDLAVAFERNVTDTVYDFKSTLTVTSYSMPIQLTVPSSLSTSTQVTPYVMATCLTASGCSISFAITSAPITTPSYDIIIIVCISIGICCAITIILSIIITTVACVWKHCRHKKDDSHEYTRTEHHEDFPEHHHTSVHPVVHTELHEHVKPLPTPTPKYPSYVPVVHNSNSDPYYNPNVIRQQSVGSADSGRINSSGTGTGQTNSSLLSALSTHSDEEETGLLKGRYQVIDTIGKGSFGVCYLCKDTKKQDQPEVAVKSITVGDTEMDRVIEECSKTMTFKHRRLVEVYDFFISKSLHSICIVMKYYHGDLEKRCKSYGKLLSQDLILKLINQLGDGLDYLHNEKNIIHRDIKPKNVFVEEFDPDNNKLEVVIGDYGEAKEVGEMNNSVRGTLSYMACEVILRQSYGQSADIFSLGVSLYQIMSGESMENMISSRLLSESENVVLDEVTQVLFSKGYDMKLVKFVVSMMQKNPSSRPTARNIKDFQM